MSTTEISHETPKPEPQQCPLCGAGYGRTVPEPGSIPSSCTCAACGAVLDPIAAAPQPGARGNRNPLALVVVAVVAAAMLYFGMHMSRRSAENAGIMKSNPAPDFTLESLDGKNLRLSDLRGKAVLLNFWATWCGPCKIETPWLVELQNQYGAQGLQVVGIAMDDSGKDDIAKFAKDMGVNYPVLLGKEAVGDAYGGVPALPESFFIGRDGKIVDKIIGLKGKGEIEDSIRKALDTQVTTATSTPPAALQAQK
jgi:thiol-disulfide isomerase/thioredoxin